MSADKYIWRERHSIVLKQLQKSLIKRMLLIWEEVITIAFDVLSIDALSSSYNFSCFSAD
jgi:hypothetical protein